jgi:predicted dienelactone hydrolase
MSAEIVPRRVLPATAFGFLSPAAARAEEARMIWHDARRDRAVPVLLRMPAAPGPAPLVLLSHGLGGSRDGLGYLGRAFAAAGFVALHLQHPGSDASVWQGRGMEGRLALAAAVTDVAQAVARLRDGAFALDEVTRRAATPDDPLHGRVDLRRMAAAGHSYGAWTVQHLMGERLPAPVPGLALPDPRLQAGIALSPTLPRGLSPAVAVAGITRPMLWITGTEDHGVLDGTAPEQREIPFRSLAGVRQALLVLHGASHFAFADEGTAGARWADPTFHARTAAVSVAFLRAALLEDTAAAASLRQGAPGILAASDRLEVKDWPAA